MSSSLSLDFESSSDVIKAGWLERKSLTLGRWAPRFYLLRDTFLFICKQEPTSYAEGVAKPDHVIWLHAGGEAKSVPAASSSTKFIFSVTVTEPSREEHLLSAHTEEEREAWVTAISAALKIVENEAAEAEAEAAATASAAAAHHAHHHRVASSSSAQGSRTPSPSRSGSSLSTTTHHHNRTVSTASTIATAASSSLSMMAQSASPASPAGASLMRGGGIGVGPDTLSPKPDPLRLDQFTLRSRNNILSGAGDEADDDKGGGSCFDPLPENDGDGDSDNERSGSSRRSGADVTARTTSASSAAASSAPDDSSMDHLASTPASPPFRPSHSRVSSALSSPGRGSGSSGSGSLGRLPPAPVVSAVDDETRSKLRQIEESGNDPELVALLAEQQVALDKLAKLRLHRKVLTNEIALLTPRLTMQTKLNGHYNDEVALHRTLQSKRTAHRIQVCKWAENMRSRLQRSEPQAFLKQQRRQQAQAMRQQHEQQLLLQQQQQQQQQRYHHPSASSRANHHHQHHLSSPSPSHSSMALPNSPASPFSNHLPPLSSPTSPMVSSSAPQSPMNPGAGSVTAVTVLSPAELIRLSNVELESVEREVRSRVPSEPVSPDLLTALQREESAYANADDDNGDTAHGRASLEQLEQWSAESRQRASSTAMSSLPPASSSSSSASDTYQTLLKTHNAALSDLAHLVCGVLLREIAGRKQLNLLQESIYRLTTQKETEYRNRYTTAAEEALAVQGKRK
jgi:hypothetical protein